MADDEREEQVVEQKTRTGAEQAAALDKVSDKAEEREMNMKGADTSKIKQAMAELAAQQHVILEAQRQKDKELAAIKIDQSDVAVVAQQFEISNNDAERILREAKGDLRQAIQTLIKA